MSNTKIEWATKVWNPVTGCTKVSQGCKNCYAEVMANRFWGKRKFTDVQCHEDRLEHPLHWKKPQRVFVNSMSDLFHEDVPFKFIRDVFSVMGCNPKHTYMVLTKRPQRMLQFIKSYYGDSYGIECIYGCNAHTNKIPIKNIWLGVSVEDQKTADERIPILLQIPAAVRFVSAEPLLGPIDLTYLDYERTTPIDAIRGLHGFSFEGKNPKLDWVIVGGESGKHARPMHPDWVRSIRGQCKEADVPFFFKQWGEWLPVDCRRYETQNPKISFGQLKGTLRKDKYYEWKIDGFNVTGITSARVGKKKAGRLLDGQEYNELPEVKP